MTNDDNVDTWLHNTTFTESNSSNHSSNDYYSSEESSDITPKKAISSNEWKLNVKNNCWA